MIDEFILSDKNEITINNLNAYERMIFHELSEKMGLIHESIGVNNLKDMKIKKKK